MTVEAADGNGLLCAALDYAARRWLVIPLHTPTAHGCSCAKAECTNVGKHPRTAHGLKDASPDASKIREWWTHWQDANIGLVTGPESSIFVLDVDGAQGYQSLIDLQSRGLHLPDTYSVRTGSGGLHLYFLWPEGADVRNSQSRIAAGLDIRGDGGYIVAPPSIHASGGCYEINESAILPARCPEWLLTLIQTPREAQTAQSAPTSGIAVSKLVGKGQRTNRLVSLAGAMHKRGMVPTAIEAGLLAENATFSPPLPDKKVRDIAREIPNRYPNAKAQPEAKLSLKPELVCLANVQTRPVEWLWEPFIPVGMLCMVSGDPGTGKSFVALAVAADLSRGRLRDGRIVNPANTLYLSVENPVAETIRPRFDSLGGDPARLMLLKGTILEANGEERKGTITLGDLATLEAAIKEAQARLVIVDPIQSYLGANVDLHRSNETRPIMDGLSRIAESYRCSFLLLRHLSKQTGGKAIHRGLGSIDLTGAVRSEMLAGTLPDEPETRALIHIKSNVGRVGQALGYRIDSQGKFAWTGECQITAADLLAAPAGPGDHKLAEATHWLTEQLKTGSREQRQIRDMAEQAGISNATLRRAKTALRVRSFKSGMSGPWMWNLAEDAHGPREDAQREYVSTFVGLSTLDGYCGGLLQ